MIVGVPAKFLVIELVGVEFLVRARAIVVARIVGGERPGRAHRRLIDRVLHLALPHEPLRRVDREPRAADQRRHAKRHKQGGVPAQVLAQSKECALEFVQHDESEPR